MFLAFLTARSKSFILSCSFTLIVVLGVLDYFTGFELSFAVFYLFPVALVAWFASKRTAVVTSIASAVAWQAANQLAGEHFSNTLIPLWNAATRLGFFLIVALLLAKLRESLAHQSELARTDFLTGAANPRAFYELAQMEINRARRYGHTFTIAYFDADNFKTVNDRLGHHVGSQLLVRVVEVMKQSLRATDVVARIGGDEFAILLPETGAEQAQVAVQKLREKLSAQMRDSGWSVTFSVGLLTCADPPHTVDEMIKIADGLMYEVKGAGKNAIRHEVLKARMVTEPASERISL
ncbi:MAG TPA: GGDEF domain-containing protein [Pyrinomonadaceae bacterium]|nr:GGDEF domain-containing protein [Pyrinomonadaceae bacterium]